MLNIIALIILMLALFNPALELKIMIVVFVYFIGKVIINLIRKDYDEVAKAGLIIGGLIILIII